MIDLERVACALVVHDGQGVELDRVPLEQFHPGHDLIEGRALELVPLVQFARSDLVRAANGRALWANQDFFDLANVQPMVVLGLVVPRQRRIHESRGIEVLGMKLTADQHEPCLTEGYSLMIEGNRLQSCLGRLVVIASRDLSDVIEGRAILLVEERQRVPGRLLQELIGVPRRAESSPLQSAERGSRAIPWARSCSTSLVFLLFSSNQHATEANWRNGSLEGADPDSLVVCHRNC